MEIGLRDTLLTLGTAAMMLAGVVLIVFADPTLTVVGIVLIGLSGAVFVVDAKDLIVKTDENAQE